MSIETKIGRRLTLAWGVHSVLVPAMTSVDEMSSYAREVVIREGFAAPGDTIIIAAGTPIGVSGTTNTLKILRL